ncbi:hypothetical protein [Nocardioides sp. Iso805N]|uniref:hypothetical protein n=1 Tax=Nocardioides sp. Iso805N TaxID=1283287 RepID=UPI000373718D|nr:hypothetical protein [Nocardioides sp. Iso805N]
MKLGNVPTRLATGAFILHTGWEKWHGDEQQANGVHGMASGAFPVFKTMKPTDFLKVLSLGEMATGAALLVPIVPPAVAGAALTGFSGALIAMYLRTDGLHKPGSVWPTPQGTPVAKDVWMLGIGLGLIVEGMRRRTQA